MTGYPFAAIVGQQAAKDALLWNLIDPALGGVLLCGEKGTGKSTLARAAAALSGLGWQELPLNATEDALTGALDLTAALREGKAVYTPGLLKQAEGGVLYVDEVNLLASGLQADLIEALSEGEPPFLLVGSMNPEEGPLRPQLLDRFGLFVSVKAEQDPARRAEIVRRELEFEADAAAFAAHFAADTAALRTRLHAARKLLPQVEIPAEITQAAAQLCASVNCEGHRGELALLHAAWARAAWEGREAVAEEDLQAAAPLALAHRSRAMQEQQENSAQTPENNAEHTVQQNAPAEPDAELQTAITHAGQAREQWDAGTDGLTAGRWLMQNWHRRKSDGSGRRSRVRTSSRQGRYVFARPASGLTRTMDLAVDATLRAAAPFQHLRPKNGAALNIQPQDLRCKQREKRTGNTILFVVDASGSAGANHRMAVVKSMIFTLLQDAYQKRDRVGLVAFRGQSAELLLPPTRSVDYARQLLQQLPTGGRTPLAEGLALGCTTLLQECRRDPDTLPVLVLVTDGRANSGKDALPRAKAAAEAVARCGFHAVVFDAEQGPVRLGLSRELARRMNAPCLPLGK